MEKCTEYLVTKGLLQLEKYKKVYIWILDYNMNKLERKYEQFQFAI